MLDNVASGLTHSLRAGVLAQIVGSPLARREKRAVEERAEEAIAFFHLDSYRDRPVGGLPYGVQKRVELARALIARPHPLLLDEPMAGITLTEKRELTGWISASTTGRWRFPACSSAFSTCSRRRWPGRWSRR